MADEVDDYEANDWSDLFEKFDEDFLKFEKIENPRHPRPDVCAFLMLHDLDPEATDIVAGAEHDEIFLSFDCDKFKGVSENIVRDLIRCGVRYDAQYDSLAMFV